MTAPRYTLRVFFEGNEVPVVFDDTGSSYTRLVAIGTQLFGQTWPDGTVRAFDVLRTTSEGHTDRVYLHRLDRAVGQAVDRAA